MKGQTMLVWFMEVPKIGYCPNCDCEAEWTEGIGWHCPVCKATEEGISVFNWDPMSRRPGGDRW